jgi:hypothetical protein
MIILHYTTYSTMYSTLYVYIGLQETHFSSQHVYTLDWQPGAEGHLYWYLDDELILGTVGYLLYSV